MNLWMSLRLSSASRSPPALDAGVLRSPLGGNWISRGFSAGLQDENLEDSE